MNLTLQSVITFLAMLILLPIITAQETSSFDPNQAFLWLVNHCPEGNCKDSIMTTALATLALKSSGALDHAQRSLDYIFSQENKNQHCWPVGGCTIKDTAFALLALNDYGKDTADIEEYLHNSLTAATELQNFWYLEAITSNSGTCKISYEKDGENVQKDIIIEKGEFTGCPQSPVTTLFDLNACLEPHLLTSHPSLELDVNCNELGPSTILSIIFTKGSDYYIIDKSESPRQIFTINNGCFGTIPKASCNTDTTLFTNWILTNAASDTTTSLYLQRAYDEFNPAHNALLYLSTNDGTKEQYLKDLIALQRNDGSFNKNIFDTSLAILALQKGGQAEPLHTATTWLQGRQHDD